MRESWVIHLFAILAIRGQIGEAFFVFPYDCTIMFYCNPWRPLKGIQCDIPPEGTTPLRYKIWHFLEVPKSSPGARYFHYFNTILIVISVFMFCFETLPFLRQNCSGDSKKCTLDKHFVKDIT